MGVGKIIKLQAVRSIPRGAHSFFLLICGGCPVKFCITENKDVNFQTIMNGLMLHNTTSDSAHASSPYHVSRISSLSPIIPADACPPILSISSRTMDKPKPAPPFARAGLLW